MRLRPGNKRPAGHGAANRPGRRTADQPSINSIAYEETHISFLWKAYHFCLRHGIIGLDPRRLWTTDRWRRRRRARRGKACGDYCLRDAKPEEVRRFLQFLL